MYSKNLKKFAYIIHGFKYLSRKCQRAIIKNINRPFLETICEITLNLYKKNLRISSSNKKNLHRHKKVVLALCNPRLSPGSKVRQLQRGKGFFIPLLFTLAAPVIQSIITRISG